MPRIVHFEIPADDPDRLVQFYGEVFGWRFQKWEGPNPYWMITTGGAEEPGIDGGMGPRQKPVDGVCNVIGVPSVDDYVKRLERNGGKIVVPKGPIPTVGWVAYFSDPDGNISGIFQGDPDAR